ncbi:MAG: glycoside hydrolase [Deltaproteobacteria bacterium]|nr:glycoside hydrolase [Deltaproteobacteria bacterium]
MEPLRVLFLWHMHQPFYKNLYTGEYLLPWVLLHGTKDYLDMLLLTSRFDRIKQNFNFVPSLIVQLLDYARGEAKDLYLEIFRKRAELLDLNEKIFILKNFFNSNWDNMIRPFSRYFELLRKRGFYYPKDKISVIADQFTQEEIRDIQILFFLSWIDPIFFEEYEELKFLKKKGRFFSEEDKTILEDAQRKIIERILPTCKKLHEDGKIELTTSPFYHPIIPLLIDTDVAKESMPEIVLPKKRFSHPEDAYAQIRKAKEMFFETFGFSPKGMWPPEGSVSDKACQIYAEEGVEYLLTDEDILFRTKKLDIIRNPLGREIYLEILYKPYIYENNGKRLFLIFRDKVLSDLISFHYSKLDPKEAVLDFMRRLREIKRCTDGKVKNPCVLIAMDGENAWEFYKNDGRDFLMYLYEAISKETFVSSVTISDYLRYVRDFEALTHVFPGSWINHNFKIWIGHQEDNLAWYLLGETRDFLESKDPNRDNKKAWESLYIAEGSDWNWWYGEEHASENDEVFDFLFRENLSNVYRFLNHEPPEELNIPILLEEREIRPKYEPTSFIYPNIDGYVTNYFEWIGSGYFEPQGSGVAMHNSYGLLKSIYYGFNNDSLFIRLDIEKDFLEDEKDLMFEISLMGSTTTVLSYEAKSEKIEGPFQAKIKFREIMEAEIPRNYLGSESKIFLWCTLKINGVPHDRIPKKGYLCVRVPDEKFEAEMWYI